MNPSQRRATALTSDQIAYIKGCARLQDAVWRFCHRDPLMALSDKVSLNVLRQAIMDLMNAREKLRKQAIRTTLQKWIRNAQNMTVSNIRKQQLLRGRVNRIDAYKRFILSQALKNWRIKAARSVDDFLNRIGAFMKLMEAAAKKKNRPAMGSFLQNMRKTIAPEYLRKPLKGCLNIYERIQNNMKSRALNNWRIKVRDMNNQLIKRQLLLKNIVKPLIANDISVLRKTVNKWKQNALGLKCKNDKMMLLRGHSTYSLYNKWFKTNMLKILSTAFNDWRRKAAKRPINYHAKIFQSKPHMLKHNINMNGEDLLNNLRMQYNEKKRRDLLRKQVNRNTKNSKLLLSQSLQKWNRIAKYLTGLKNRRDAILRGRVNKNELYTRMMLSHRFNIWRVAAVKDDWPAKYGSLLRFLNLLTKKALKPIKVDFMNQLYNYRNINYYKKALPKMISLNKRCRDYMKRKAFNDWRNKTTILNSLLDKRNYLLKNLLKSKQEKQNNILRRFINQWNKTSNNMKNDIDNLVLKRGVTTFSLYNKWNKSNKVNTIASAFNEWRRKAAIKPVDYNKLIMESTPHILKYNINLNGEDLLNSLRSKHYFAKRQNILKKAIKKGDKAKDFNLKNTLRKWYVNSLKMDKNNKILEKLLRKAIYKWLRNASQPKTALPNTEKACDLIRKATTEPFFTKLREKMQKKNTEDRFKSIISSVLRNQDKNSLRDYVNLWRTNTRKLRAYDMNAIFLNQFMKNKEGLDKIKLLYSLRDRANIINTENDKAQRILTNLVTKLDSLNKLNMKEQLGKYLYKWKSNCSMMKNPFDVVAPYLEGSKILENFCRRTNHMDLVKAFDCNLTVPAQINSLSKLVKLFNKKYVFDSLKRSLATWKENTKDKGQLKKLRKMFDDYTLLNTEQLMSPYKDLCQAIIDYCNQRNSKTGVITDFLRGLKDLPNQLKSMKRTQLLLKIMNKNNVGKREILRSAFMDWQRRARCHKQESCSNVIQKFIRDKLVKRIKEREKYENFAELITRHIKGKVYDRIAEFASKNILKDILLKYFNMKDANNMKILKSKFDKWNGLIPYLRQIDAATYIQSWYRGGKLRGEFNRYNRINELLMNILTRYKNDPGPYFQKWAKNARRIKAEEMNLVIQNFIRTRLANRLKAKSSQKLQGLFKDYIFKQIADILKYINRFNPEDYDKFEQIIRNATTRKPYEKIKSGLRWIAIMKGMGFLPDLLEKLRRTWLKKYLDRWFENGYLVPGSAANLIQAYYRGYKTMNLFELKKTLNQKLKNILQIYAMKKEDFLRSSLLKWNKTSRRMKCDDDGNTIREFCRFLREKVLLETQNKWKYLSHRLLPHQINKIFKFAKINNVLSKLNKKRFMEKFNESATFKFITDILATLLSKYDDNAKKYLLRRRFNDWLEQTRRLRDYQNSMATLIQNHWRNYNTQKKENNKLNLKVLLQRFIGRILNKSELSLPSAFYRWSKIQDY